MRPMDVREGQTVRTIDGEKLGKVVACREDDFVIEKGFFLQKDYRARYETVARIDDGEIFLDLSREEAQRQIDQGSEELIARSAGMSAGAEALAGGEEHRMTLEEEELLIDKQKRQTGEVAIKKEVTTEQRTVTVPVTREEVTVERTAGPGTPGTGELKADEIRVPVYEERVEVSKRPVVREEVRVRKEERTEPQKVSETIRKERADVKGAGVRRLDKDKDERRPH